LDVELPLTADAAVAAGGRRKPLLRHRQGTHVPASGYSKTPAGWNALLALATTTKTRYMAMLERSPPKGEVAHED
jgi:hypothetical protein